MVDVEQVPYPNFFDMVLMEPEASMPTTRKAMAAFMVLVGGVGAN